MAKKLTLEKLIENRIAHEKQLESVKDIFVKSLNGSLEFIRPDNETVLRMMEKINDGTDIRANVKAYSELIYDCCPMLHNQELHDEYGVKDPYVIVDKLFEITDILEVGEQIFNMAGITPEAIDEAVKK